MTIKYLNSATVHFVDSDRTRNYPTLVKARNVAESFVGNRSATKPFADEDTYLYGPGDGDTTVIVRRDIDMDALMGRTAVA